MESLLSQASACTAKGSVPFYFITLPQGTPTIHRGSFRPLPRLLRAWPHLATQRIEPQVGAKL